MSQTKLRSPLMPKTATGGKGKKKSSGKNAAAETYNPDMIEMRSETLPSRTVLATDREERINFTLDMIVHDLITQGHVSVSRAAYMLKSPEMKDHVGRICDEMLERRAASLRPKKAGTRPQTSVPPHIYQPHGPNQHGAGAGFSSEPTSDMDIGGRKGAAALAAANSNALKASKSAPQAKKKPKTARPSSAGVRMEGSKMSSGMPSAPELNKKSTTGPSQSASTNKTKKPANAFGENGAQSKKSGISSGQENGNPVPVIKNRSVSKPNNKMKIENEAEAAGGSSSTFRPTAPKIIKPVSILKTSPTEQQILNGILNDIPSTSQLNQIFNFPPPFEAKNTDATAYRTRVDLSGFTNDNISLDLDGRRLIIVAFRPKDRNTHARKITEIVDIPENVDLENLKIGRRPDGALIVEEIVNL